jgi:hypothetical protein
VARFSIPLARAAFAAGLACGSLPPCPPCAARRAAGSVPWFCPAPWGCGPGGPVRLPFLLGRVVAPLSTWLGGRVWLLRFAWAVCRVSVGAAAECASCPFRGCPRHLRPLPGSAFARLPGWGAAGPLSCSSTIVCVPLFLRACRLFRLLPAGRTATHARRPIRGSLGSWSGGA